MFECVLFALCRCGVSVCLSGGTSSLVSIWQRFPLSLILYRQARSTLQALGSPIFPGIQVPEDRLPLSFHPDSKESRSLAICVYSHLRGKAHASALRHVGTSHSSCFSTTWVGEALGVSSRLYMFL